MVKGAKVPASKILTVKEELKSQPKSTGTKIPSKEKKKRSSQKSGKLKK